MGIVSDVEIQQLVCGSNESYARAFEANLEEASGLHVFTQAQALDYIGKKVKLMPKTATTSGRRAAWINRRSNPDEALEVLATVVIAHVPVHDLNFRPKAIYIALMVRRVLMAMENEKSVDDRDYVGNKRLELCVDARSDISDASAPVSSSRCSSRTCSNGSTRSSRRRWKSRSRSCATDPSSTPAGSS